MQPLKNASQDKLIYTDIFEAFFVQVKVGLFAAMMVSFPVFATQMYRFVAPGLYRNEKKAFLPFSVDDAGAVRIGRVACLFWRDAGGAEILAGF